MLQDTAAVLKSARRIVQASAMRATQHTTHCEHLLPVRRPQYSKYDSLQISLGRTGPLSVCERGEHFPTRNVAGETPGSSD